MIVLGIDTAMRCTGYGIVEATSDSSFRAVDCGVIKNPPKVPHSECLRRLAGGIRELVSTYKPDAASIEGAFYGKNIRTALILGYARGCIMTVLAERCVPTYAYSPKEVKLAAVGFGGAQKSQVAYMMSSILHIDVTGVEEDATDALALALCHAQRVLRVGGEEFGARQI